MQTVLTIAGFDPSSGAGVTADLMVFAAHGLFGTSCITGLTVQSTRGVRSVHPVSDTIVRETLECLHEDLPPSGIKIGMLSGQANLFRVCEYLENNHLIHSGQGPEFPIVVLDPVVRSTSGRELLDEGGLDILRERLLPLVDWVTPNLEELAFLSGRTVAQREDVPGACRALQTGTSAKPGSGRLGVLATGGHLHAPDDFLLTPAGEEFWLPGERVNTKSTHGTGYSVI